MKVPSDLWYPRAMETTKTPFAMAEALYTRLWAEASGPDGTYCVPAPVQRRIAAQLQEQTGWTEQELKDRMSARPDVGPAIVPVHPTTDVRSLARRMADHGRAGGRVVMYPVSPFH